MNDTDNRGKSALYYAVERRNMVSAYGLHILEAGANVEGKYDKERTVLHHVMRRGGWKEKSALHYAAARAYVVAATKLVEGGESIEGKDDEGRTVLHLAAGFGDVKLLHLIIKNNANVNDRDNKSQSALQYALKSHNVVAAMTLLKAGASVEGKDDEGRTVLHLAAKYGNGSFFSC